jgi:hypothetical protein
MFEPKMVEPNQNAPWPTPQELDQAATTAVADFKACDWQGEELINFWQKIREAALAQFAQEPPIDGVAGTDSY